MTFRAFLWSVGLLTLGALGVFLATLFLVSPDESGLYGRLLFFGSAWVVFVGVATIVLSEIYQKCLKDEDVSVYTGIIFRQGVFVGGYVLGIFLFQYWGILFWWTALLLLVAFLLIELSCREWIDSED